MKTADKQLTRRVERLEAAARTSKWQAAAAEWATSYAAFIAGEKSLNEHQEWVLSTHRPEQRETFRQLWQDVEETLRIFESLPDYATSNPEIRP